MASEAFVAIVEFLRESNLLGDPDASPQDLRAAMAGAGLIPLADDVVVEPIDAGGVPGEWTRVPGVRDDAALLYLHGGGYVIGSPDTHRRLCGALARATGAPVLSLDYRLAPEHPHPAAVNDSTTAYSFLLESGVSGVGLAPSRLAIAGDSAGGGLTVATLVKLRDDGVAQPGAAVAISPWVDMTMTGESMVTLADADPLVKPVGIAKMRDWFIGDTDPTDPYASPLFADLSGLAPLLIHVGEIETLLDDSRRLHAAIVAAGGDSTIVEFPEMIHVFHAFAEIAPESDAAIGQAAEFVRKHLGL
jgi:acetyl esterase/lipase